MQKERDVKKTSGLIPFLIGGLVGAGIALLLAPKSGREFRNDIKKYAARTKDALDTAVDEGRRI